MAVPSGASSSHFATSSSEISQVYYQGIIAGIIGAATIAVWFLLR
jgi:hypothetical protein